MSLTVPAVDESTLTVDNDDGKGEAGANTRPLHDLRPWDAADIDRSWERRLRRKAGRQSILEL